MIYTDGIHLVAESLDELHSFAQSIGIKRIWFEGVRKCHPHYDIPKNMRIQFKGNGHYANFSIDDKLTLVEIVESRYILKVSKKSSPCMKS